MLHWSQGGQGHWHFALSVSLHRCTAGQAAAVRRPVFPPHGNGAAGKQKSWEQSRSRDRSRRARGTDNTSFSTRCGKSQFSELSSFQGPTFWDLDSQKHHSEILGLLSALDTENNSNDIPKLRRHKRKKRGKTRFSPPHQHPKAFVARVATTAESACAVARAHAQSRPGACREFQPLRMLGPARCDTELGPRIHQACLSQALWGRNSPWAWSKFPTWEPYCRGVSFSALDQPRVPSWGNIWCQAPEGKSRGAPVEKHRAASEQVFIQGKYGGCPLGSTGFLSFKKNYPKSWYLKLDSCHLRIEVDSAIFFFVHLEIDVFPAFTHPLYTVDLNRIFLGWEPTLRTFITTLEMKQ